MRRAGWLAVLGLLFAGCLGGNCDDPEPIADPKPDLVVRPEAVQAEYLELFNITATASCSGCRTNPPIVMEVTVGQPHLVIDSVHNSNQEVTMESTVAPARATLTFQTPEPGSAASATITVRCAQIGKSNVTVTWLDPAKKRDLTATASVECIPPQPIVVEDPKEFANGLGELVQVARQAAAWVFNAGGVAANLGERTADMRSKFTAIGPDCERYEGITDFRSERGADSLVAETSLQKGTATFDEGQQRYVWTGLQQGPVFGQNDSVRFSWADKTETVPAPAPFRAPDQVLSPPAGAETTLHVRPGDATTVAIFGQLTGNSGFPCRKEVAALPTNNAGDHVVRLVPAEVVEAIPDVMTKLQNVYVAQLNSKKTPFFFPNRNRALDAARVLSIPRSALDP